MEIIKLALVIITVYGAVIVDSHIVSAVWLLDHCDLRR